MEVWSSCLCLLLAAAATAAVADLGIDLRCEDLVPEECAFAVASSGARCVLEKEGPDEAGNIWSQCKTSSIMAQLRVEWIETDECIQACGLQRLTYGLSSDALLEDSMTRMLCSHDCQLNCPNLLQLHLELAADEGIYLPDLCQAVESYWGKQEHGHMKSPSMNSDEWDWSDHGAAAPAPATAPASSARST